MQFLLGNQEQGEGGELETHPVFSEMEELFMGEDGDLEWKETARSLQQFIPSCSSYLMY